MADYADSGSRMSDFGEGRSMSDFGGGSQPPPQPSPALQAATRTGRRVPKAAVAAAAAVVAAVVIGGVALASRSSDVPDETALETDTTAGIPTTIGSDTTTVAQDREGNRPPFLFAGSSQPTPELEVGESGKRTEVFLRGGATGVAVAEDGRVFILDASGFGSLWEVDGDEITLLLKGNRDAFPNIEFSQARDLAVRDSGDDVELFVADAGGRRIIRYVPATNELETWGADGETGVELVQDGTPVSEMNFATPVSVDVDDEGNVWAADLNKLALIRVGTDDRVTVVSGRGFDRPTDGAKAIDVRFSGLKAVAVDSQGRAVVSANNELWRIETNGTVSKLAGTGVFPDAKVDQGDGGPALQALVSAADLAFSDSDDLYIASDSVAGDIRRISADGRIERLAGGDPGGGSTPPTSHRFAPDSIDVDEDDRIYVGESLNGFNMLRRLPAGGVPLDTARFRFDMENRVGRADDLTREGAAPDHILEVVAEGDIADVIVEECGNDDAVWDTITGNDTPGVGVARLVGAIENDDTTGDLPAISLDEPTILTLYFEDDGEIGPGDRLCVTLVRPDGSEEEQELVIRGFD